MAIDLSLTQVQVPGPRTSRPSINVGAGLQSLGESISRASTTLQKVTKEEDASKAYAYALQKAQDLDQLQLEIKKGANFETLNDRMGIAFKEFVKQSTQEMKDLGISKLGSAKLFPRVLDAYNSLAEYRTKLGQVEAQSKLADAARALEEHFPHYGVATKDITEPVKQDDGTVISAKVPTIRFDNERLVVQDLIQLAETVDQVTEFYGLDPAEGPKFLEEVQATFQDNILAYGMNQNPGMFLTPEFAQGQTGVETITINPITKQLDIHRSVIDPTKVGTLIETATARRQKLRSDEEGEQKQKERNYKKVDLATRSDIIASLEDFESASALKRAINDGVAIIDKHGKSHTFKFNTETEKMNTISALQSIIASGGIPRESDPEVLAELQVATMSGLNSFITNPYAIDITDEDGNVIAPALTYSDAISRLSESDRKELKADIFRNQSQAESQFQREFREQTGFINVFWGKLTNFVSIFEGSSSAIAAKTRSRLHNAVAKLNPDERRNLSRKDFNQLTFDIITEEMEGLVASELGDLDITQIQQFEQLAGAFKDETAVEAAAFDNEEDRALALFLVKIRDRKLSKEVTPAPSADKPKTSSRKRTTSEVVVEALQSLIDALNPF